MLFVNSVQHDQFEGRRRAWRTSILRANTGPPLGWISYDLARPMRQMSAIGRQDRSQGLLRSEQRLDRCDSHQILHGLGELPIERDQSVGLELGQGDVLGVNVSDHPSWSATFHATF